jgi:hypothetical protein
MNDELKPFVEIVKTGSRGEVKRAKKEIESYWHNVYIKQRERGREAFRIFFDEIEGFDEIEDADHQADFVSVLKWSFWAIGKEYFDRWVDFVMKCIQHDSGKVRMQTIHSADILMLSLFRDSRSGGSESDKFERMAKTIDLIRFGLWVYSVNQLLMVYHEPKFKRYKYVSSLPVGVYKSLQKFVNEVLLRAEYWKQKWQIYLLLFKEQTDEVYTGNYSRDLKVLLGRLEEQIRQMADSELGIPQIH